jgi:hypothetical protein
MTLLPVKSLSGYGGVTNICEWKKVGRKLKSMFVRDMAAKSGGVGVQDV